MKKLVPLLLVAIMAISLSACSAPQKKDVELEKLNATEVIQMLKDTGFPLKEITTYDEKTDPNLLLGRPNQYTSKAEATDTLILQIAYDKTMKDFVFQTIEEFEATSVHNLGVDVEVFDTPELAKKRMDYIQSFSYLVHEYDYIQGGVLMRVSGYLTPSQAKVYEKALQDMADGNKPKYEESKQ